MEKIPQNIGENTPSEGQGLSPFEKNSSKNG